ncbi:MAG: hypothetical protein HFJ47_00735 [Clostridia bacterium]|nr:hypothetical protein [Clostridia bacterium]
MWPSIIKKGGTGIKFDENFWDIWGPSNMFYFNPELFNDERKIKSIYFKYLNHNQLEFDPSEIAMGLIYECHEFGEHTVLFSYNEIPNITTNLHSWDHFVLPYFETDDNRLVNMYNDRKLMLEGKMSKTEMYIKYLEGIIIYWDNNSRQIFRNLCHSILNEYIHSHTNIKPEMVYQTFLESIVSRILVSDDSLTICSSIQRCYESKDFLKIINGIMDIKLDENLLKERIKCEYSKHLKELDFLQEENDLDSIYRECRDLFLNRVVQYKEEHIDSSLVFNTYFDTDLVPYFGRIVKDADGKPIFEEIEREFDVR